MIGRRPLSPSFYAAPWWEPQSGGPGPAKRRRIEEPTGPEHGMAPSLQGPAESRPADALTYVVVVAAGCALQLPLDGVDLVLEPEPTSVLHVCLGGHTVVLVPEALLGSGAGAHSPVGLEPGASPQGFLCAFVPEIAAPEIAASEFAASEFAAPEFAAPDAVPEIAVPEMVVPEIVVPEEAYQEDVASQFLTPWMVAAAGSDAGTGFGIHPHGPIREPWPRAPTPSPERRSPGPYYDLHFHLWEPFPSSPLQPLPPSPSPGPRVRPRRPLGPAPKARKRLFQE